MKRIKGLNNLGSLDNIGNLPRDNLAPGSRLQSIDQRLQQCPDDVPLLQEKAKILFRIQPLQAISVCRRIAGIQSNNNTQNLEPALVNVLYTMDQRARAQEVFSKAQSPEEIRQLIRVAVNHSDVNGKEYLVNKLRDLEIEIQKTAYRFQVQHFDDEEKKAKKLLFKSPRNLNILKKYAELMKEKLIFLEGEESRGSEQEIYYVQQRLAKINQTIAYVESTGDGDIAHLAQQAGKRRMEITEGMR